MRYDYRCEKCRITFEVSHGMDEKPIIKCDKCQKPAERVFSMPVVYVKGNGYLDRAGCKRDMNLHKLTNDDPYRRYRQRGEADDLKHRLRKGGKFNPNSKTFTTKNTNLIKKK